jgi:branched-chain amino acid transport system ATP-binding protein
MTVRENLLLGAYRRRDHAGIARDLDWIYELFPILAERRRQPAGSMSGGEQQMCAIGRGLMAKPRLLILDELSLGLAPIMLDTLVDALATVHHEGTTIFVVEQDVATAFDLASTGYVLENGRIVLAGPTSELRSNPHVKKAYLGL